MAASMALAGCIWLHPNEMPPVTLVLIAARHCQLNVAQTAARARTAKRPQTIGLIIEKR